MVGARPFITKVGCFISPNCWGGIFGFHPWLYVIITTDPDNRSLNPTDPWDLMAWAQVSCFEDAVFLRWPHSVSSSALLRRVDFRSFYTLAPRGVGRALSQ